MKVEDILLNIQVWNCYAGFMSALCAFSNGYWIELHSDRNKIRRMLKKHGYKCSFNGGIICKIIKL